MEVYILVLAWLVFLGFKIANNVKNEREWHDGLFEKEVRNEGSNYDRLLESYISLAALMVRKDTAAYGEKVLFLNSYFSQYFPETHYNFGRSFTDSLKNPVKPKVLFKWIRKKLPQHNQRMQVMYFLAGIATVDGSMNNREVEFLKEILVLLELTPEDFESIMAIYTQKQERTRSTESAKPRISAVLLACKIIGVHEHASEEEIKKAYRKLVMLHHPDHFSTETQAQQQIASERFIEIQKACEVLERRKR